ncbi:hypothetical protein LUZ60_007974 [Juncus effusus]|nr:hypothetical protein LUZ60_007974 [Juncus effusus]
MPRESSHGSRDTVASTGRSRRRNQPIEIDQTPIDLVSIDDDDDVIIVSPSRPRAQASNVSRRRRPSIVCLDDDVEEVNVRQSARDEEVRIVSGSNHNKRVRISPTDKNTRQSKSRSRNKPTEAQVEPVQVQPVPPKEPTFTCPVCLNQLTEPCSTICGHVFCQSCIKASIQAQKKCPTCRRKLNKNNFHRVYLPNTTVAN